MNPSKALSKLDGIIARLGKFKPIRAYHGSPHSFSRFDSSKIGTGEGAQAFGHGLYFAGNEKVASDTRDAIMARMGAPGETFGRDVWTSIRGRTPASGDNSEVMRQSILALQERMAAGQQPTDPSGWSETPYKDAIRWLSSQDPALPPPGRPGHMYEVDIALPEELFLDWDAPMSGQPRVARQLLGGLGTGGRGAGKQIWRDATTRLGEGFDDDMTGDLAATAAARELLDAGIPGIRYLDQGSRAAGEGTRNYVIFPGAEDAITILRKYGFLPPAAAAAAMSGEEQ